MPEFIIIPQKELSEFLRQDYSNWVGKMKRDGSNRKRTTMRIFDPYRKSHIMEFAKKYIGNWDILNLE